MKMNEQHLVETSGPLSGVIRAAIILRALGEDAASQVMRHMDEPAIAKISAAMSRLQRATPAILGDVLHEFSVDLGLDGGGVDGLRYVSAVLISALGEDHAREILDRLKYSGRGSPLNLPATTDPRTLAIQMANERPQTIALLLAHIPQEAGAQFLSFLPEALASEALYRFAMLDVVSPGAVIELREMLAELDETNDSRGKRLTNLGGVRQAADILNHLHGGLSERMLGSITERDNDTAQKIRDSLFTFIDLGKLPDRSLQIVLREVPNERLAPALRLVDESVRAKFFQNMSARMVEVLQEELKSGAPMRRTDALAAQKDIIDIVLRLVAEGRITVSASEEMV
jgi:flagellar motor switch protein FliG